MYSESRRGRCRPSLALCYCTCLAKSPRCWYPPKHRRWSCRCSLSQHSPESECCRTIWVLEFRWDIPGLVASPDMVLSTGLWPRWSRHRDAPLLFILLKKPTGDYKRLDTYAVYSGSHCPVLGYMYKGSSIDMIVRYFQIECTSQNLLFNRQDELEQFFDGIERYLSGAKNRNKTRALRMLRNWLS